MTQTSNNNLPSLAEKIMSTARSLIDAERRLELLKAGRTDEFHTRLADFTRSVYDVYDSLLDEYNRKFGCKIVNISLDRFKSKAKKTGNVEAIAFLIWYEREFRAVRDDPKVGYLLERQLPMRSEGVLESCSTLLEKTKSLVYSAYEKF